MMDRPLHRRIHLSRLSQEVGPPQAALAMLLESFKVRFSKLIGLI
jgi:hypothetical protein